MNTHVGSGTRADSSDGRYLPAYGPVDAALGYGLFYIVVDRTTPAVVDVLGGILDGGSAATVRLGLAAFLWFVLAVMVLEQARRQLAALGLVGDANGTDGTGGSTRSPTVPSETRALAYVVLLALGGLVAAWTFEGAMAALVSLIRVVAALDTGAFVPGELLVLALFFISFEAATRAADRLVVGGFRTMLAD